MTHQLDSPASVAFKDIAFVFEYLYEFTFLPAIWDTICHYSLQWAPTYVNSSGFISATSIITNIGTSCDQHALVLPIFDSTFFISVSFTYGICPCTGVCSISSLSFSTFSSVSNDSFHLALIRQNTSIAVFDISIVS